MGKTAAFDAAGYFDRVDMMVEYLNQSLARGGIDLLLATIRFVTKARGTAQVARDTQLGHESFYKALPAGAKHRFDTVFKVLQALGVRMHAQPQAN